MNTLGTYDLWCDGEDDDECITDGLFCFSLEEAYERAKDEAAKRGKVVNVWRVYADHDAMLGSVYPDGKIIGIRSKDTWELTEAALG